MAAVRVRKLSGRRTFGSVIMTRRNRVSPLSHISIIGGQRASSTYTIVYDQLNKCKTHFY